LAWWREGGCIWLGGGRADAFGLVEGGRMHLAWWREGRCIWLGGGRADAFGLVEGGRMHLADAFGGGWIKKD